MSSAADGPLTILELGELPFLQKGYADFYQETLRPYPVAVTNTMLVEVRGNLEDGRSFKLHMNHTDLSRLIQPLKGIWLWPKE